MILRSSNTVHTEVVQDEDAFQMDSSEEFADEERVRGDVLVRSTFTLGSLDLDEPSSIIVGMFLLAFVSWLAASLFVSAHLLDPTG
ncbi:hypothetical protein L6452_19221 [Arctium lappa]|uniref:Uncharacterized protein n=1 Tax=Arctium lappa TaxID=4217 RepID=A0ACB9B7K4_ARCLA|nr:hypothetical protein L6452_19221 [Arctium lappa]